MKFKSYFFLPLVILFLYSCGEREKVKTVSAIDHYEQAIDSFSLLLNTFNDPNPDSLIVKIKNLEKEFSGIILKNNENLSKSIDALKVFPRVKKNLNDRFSQLQMKANLLLQKILFNKEMAMIKRLEEAKNTLNAAVNDFYKYGPQVGAAISQMNERQIEELNATIEEVKTLTKIKIDSLNRQYIELRGSFNK